MVVPFRDRRDAGRRLSERLREYAGRADVVVLGLARGGLPVAFEVATELELPLDVAVVRKLGVPGQEELAMGAIAGGGARVLNDELMAQWPIPDADIRNIEARERREFERREGLYRGDRLPIPLSGRTVLLIDDGLATGSTMRAAAMAARTLGAKHVVAAVPIAAPEVRGRLTPEVDVAIFLAEPNPFWAVGIWYEDFRPTTDEEVRRLLQEASDRPRSNPMLPCTSSPTLPDRLRAHAKRMDSHGRTLEYLAKCLADAQVVMICDSSSGKREFHQLRTELTKYLVADHEFRLVALDTDWSAVNRVDRYVHCRNDDGNGDEAITGLSWQWRSSVVRDFTGWMRDFNHCLPGRDQRVSFVGLDLYCQQRSMQAVVDYLDRVELDAGNRARRRYAPPKDMSSRDAASPGYLEDQVDGVVQCVIDHWEQTVARVLESEQRVGQDAHLIEQLAELRANAADYYRALFRGGFPARSRHDQHVAATLDSLLSACNAPGKIVVWGHNAHIGDGDICGPGGEWQLGQYARQRHGNAVRLVGMTTYQGTVAVTSGWGEPVQCKRINQGTPESCEALFHQMREPAFLLMLRQACAATSEYIQPCPSRRLDASSAARTALCDDAIVQLAGQFDVLIHLDETTALKPLDQSDTGDDGPVAAPLPRAVHR